MSFVDGYAVTVQHLLGLGAQGAAIGEDVHVVAPHSDKGHVVLNSLRAKDGDAFVAMFEAVTERAWIDALAVHVMDAREPKAFQFVAVSCRDDDALGTHVRSGSLLHEKCPLLFDGGGNLVHVVGDRGVLLQLFFGNLQQLQRVGTIPGEEAVAGACDTVARLLLIDDGGVQAATTGHKGCGHARGAATDDG